MEHVLVGELSGEVMLQSVIKPERPPEPETEKWSRFPDLVRAQHDAGHTHCNHTVDHRPLVPRPRDQVLAELTGGADFLTAIDGVRPELFRAPYGLLSPEVVDIAAAEQLGCSAGPSTPPTT